GYRYYDASQVPIGQVIRRFRDLGMPLDQLKDVLHAPDAASRKELIVAHLRQMEEELVHTQQTVASLRAILERPVAPITVEYRTVVAASALAISEPVAMVDIETWWGEAFDELHQALGSMHGTRCGPDGALYPSEFFEDELGVVVAYIPVGGEPEPAGPEPAGRVQLVEIPDAELAVTVHHGVFAELDQTYGSLGTFVAEREIGVAGPIREHYVVSNEHTDDESRHRTEVCWPVFHTKGGTT
ncbi:MAG: MerR family transcriptional regulator, partial [Acidimicrobiales bacterium]